MDPEATERDKSQRSNQQQDTKSKLKGDEVDHLEIEIDQKIEIINQNEYFAGPYEEDTNLKFKIVDYR